MTIKVPRNNKHADRDADGSPGFSNNIPRLHGRNTIRSKLLRMDRTKIDAADASGVKTIRTSSSRHWGFNITSTRYVLFPVVIAVVSLGHVWRMHQSVVKGMDAWASNFPASEFASSATTATKFMTYQQQQKEEIVSQRRGFDNFAPRVIRGISHFLPSLPNKHRIPARYLFLSATSEMGGTTKNTSTISDYFQNWTMGVDPDALFMYNPSIVAIPPATKARLQEEWNQRQKNDMKSTQQPRGHSTRQGRGGTTIDPVYLVSFRLSSTHGCGFETYAFWEHGPRDVFGFALLDTDLKRITGLDIILELPYSRNRRTFQDVRLFQWTNMDGRRGEMSDDALPQLFLSAERFLIPIRISIPPSATVMVSSAHAEPVKKHKSDPTGNTTTNLRTLPNLYGNGLRVQQMGQVVFDISYSGKNFQFFQLPEQVTATTSEENEDRINKNDKVPPLLMEAWPASPRVVLAFNASATRTSPSERSFDTKSSVLPPYTWKEFSPTEKNFTTEYLPPVMPRSLAEDRIMQRLSSRDRGTACCATAPRRLWHDLMPLYLAANPSLLKAVPKLDSLDSLLIGIAHTKTNRPVHQEEANGSKDNDMIGYVYVSRFYVFAPLPPYPLVARSNIFCFGFPNTTTDTIEDPYVTVTHRLNRMYAMGESFKSCPRLHFASGIVDKVGDPNILIVAYGINDCVSRLVELDKRDILLRLLLIPHAEHESEIF